MRERAGAAPLIFTLSRHGTIGLSHSLEQHLRLFNRLFDPEDRSVAV